LRSAKIRVQSIPFLLTIKYSMKQSTALVLTLLMGLFLTLGPIDDAEAKRFGGGRSFGGRSAYSNPYKRSVAPRKSLSQKRATAQNQRLRDKFSRRGGLMGMLGGLALGGLLGSLLFGGAFQGLNMMDFLVFGLIAFVLYKIFAAKKRAGAYPPTGDGYQPSDADFSDDGYRRSMDRTFEPEQKGGRTSPFKTDLLFDKGGRAPATDLAEQPLAPSEAPAGFDESGFLEGARAAYRRLQAAWDKGDLAEIRDLATDKVFAEIQEQLRGSDAGNRTEILKLDAELLEVRDTGTDWEATVLFDAILREEQDQRPAQVREVWHFVRPVNSIQPTWFLDGIQQLEE
jgi:predicted lipid-binding transport protein (Tim44 family)